MTDAELLADLDQTLAVTEAVVAGVGTDQWASAKAPFGTAPGAAMVHVRIVENLVHGWDLARASGQPTEFPDEVAERFMVDWGYPSTPYPPSSTNPPR